MITGEIKSKIDQIWNAFWSGGISNPLEVMEQMTYLLFIRRLDEIQITKEKKANKLSQIKKQTIAVEHPIFTPEQDHLRWSKFITLGDAATLYNTVANEVFPFIKNLGAEDETTYSHHMKDARFTIPTPALLTKVVDLVADVPMDDKDTKGDIYEYMLGKIASAGQNGQFRTPRHIIKMIVELMQPKPTDTICDPACGTAGFLVAASEYLNDHHSTEIFANPEAAKRFSEETFFGYDFDSTMLRIGSMNM
ncbi:MAG: N-6 DNA methylase, partial [Chryseobacterium sp.]|nr:N-6 DNA methylase [Chryseobacterium sp.]